MHKKTEAKAAKEATHDLAKSGKTSTKGKEVETQKKKVISNITKYVTTSPRTIHDLTSVITRTKLSQSFKNMPRTYMQGQTASTTPETQRWILITEATERQSPSHYELMRKVTH